MKFKNFLELKFRIIGSVPEWEFLFCEKLRISFFYENNQAHLVWMCNSMSGDEAVWFFFHSAYDSQEMYKPKNMTSLLEIGCFFAIVATFIKPLNVWG